MINAQPRRWLQLSIWVFVGYFTFLTVILSGCEPLRKKFTRKKKAQTEETAELPVLEPIEYPKKVYTPQEVYKNHYMLTKVWFQELLESLSDGSGNKRKLYLVGQVNANLTAMQELLTAEKQSRMEKILNKLKLFEEDVKAPVSTRSLSSWGTQLRSIEKEIRMEFAIKKVEGSFKP